MIVVEWQKVMVDVERERLAIVSKPYADVEEAIPRGYAADLIVGPNSNPRRTSVRISDLFGTINPYKGWENWDDDQLFRSWCVGNIEIPKQLHSISNAISSVLSK